MELLNIHNNESVREINEYPYHTTIYNSHLGHWKNKTAQFDQIMNQLTAKNYTGMKLGACIFGAAASLSPQMSI